MAAPATEAMVKLQSSDGNTHEVPKAVAERSVLIKNLLGDLPDVDLSTEPIPIPSVCSTSL